MQGHMKTAVVPLRICETNPFTRTGTFVSIRTEARVPQVRASASNLMFWHRRKRSTYGERRIGTQFTVSVTYLQACRAGDKEYNRGRFR